MTLTDDLLLSLAKVGATVEICPDGTVKIIGGVSSKQRRTERNQRHYERLKASESVLKTTESSEITDTPPPSSLPLPPSPSPALLSPTPPILPSPPAPSDPHSSPTPTAVLVKPRKAKREQRQTVAAEANAELVPASLGHAVFAVAWLDWCEYRTEMAEKQGIDWTPRAARLTLAECARYGTALAVAALRKAMARSWRGLVWKDLEADAAAIESYELVAEKSREPEPEEDLMALLLANRAKTAAREAALATPHDEEESRTWTSV